MVAYRILFVAGAAAALPLNINLGAYSPALVVGTIAIPKTNGEIVVVQRHALACVMSTSMLTTLCAYR